MTRLPPEVEEVYEEWQRAGRSGEWRVLLLNGQIVEVHDTRKRKVAAPKSAPRLME